MECIYPIGRDILASFGPTYKAYGDLLQRTENALKIQAVNREMFSYGSHERQKLDLYTPSENTPKPMSNKPRPIVVFAYGGAFAMGDKILKGIPDNLAYKNMGYFFAEEMGFDTIVMDYRLLSHGARFPSGGEDIGKVMDWVETRFGSGSSLSDTKRDLFIIGNSTGAVHVSTWLFGEQFSRRKDALVSGDQGVTLTGVVMLGCPFKLDFNGGMRDKLQIYYGGEKETKDFDPWVLMERATLNGSGAVQAWPKLLTVVSELDPEDIYESGKDFSKAWEDRGGEGSFMEIRGHNHLSPPLSLGTGVQAEQAWGHDVAAWMLATLY